jgi:hypothetical protein
VATTLLLLQFFRIDIGIFQLFLALSSSCFLVGYAILNIFRIDKYFSRLESYVVSFLISIAFSGFSFIVLNLGGHAELLMSIPFLVVGIISFVVTIMTGRKRNTKSRPSSLSRPIDVLAISICVVFYLTIILLLYPNAASLIGTDVSRHFAYSAVLVRTPDLYSAPFYLLFHSFQGSIALLSGENQPFTVFISSFAFFNIFLPLSVYAGSKRFLATLDIRVPGLLIIFYTFFSNLSFIYFTFFHTMGLETSANEYALIVREVAEKSYFGIINLLQPFIFVAPLTISIIGMMILISLLRNESLPKYRYVGLFSFLVISLSLIHVPEIALFGLLIALYTIIGGKALPRSEETLIAIIIGFFVAAILFVTISVLVLRNDAPLGMILLSFLLPSIISILSLIWNRRKVNLKFMLNHYLQTCINNKLEGITFAIVIAYMMGIILWFFIEDFESSPLLEIGIVPSFIYPVLLGIVGLLAVFSIRNLRNEDHRCIIFFLLFGILLFFIIGKVLSFITTDSNYIPYWEKRIPPLIFVFASMLAPLAVTNIHDHIFRRRNKAISAIMLTTVIGSIILLGFSSLATQMEYWNIRAKGDNKAISYQHLDPHDTDAINGLRKIIDEHPSSVTISPSPFSRHVTTFATPAYQFSKPDILFSSKLPEIPLIILGGLAYDRIYVYIHDRDLDVLNSYPNSWFSKHLLNSLPVVYRNEEVTIFNATGLRFPQPVSDTALIIPTQPESDNWMYAYDAIARTSINYSQMLDRDRPSFKDQSNIVFTADPSHSFSYNLDFTSRNASQDFWKTEGKWEQRDDGLYGLGNYSESAIPNVLVSDFTTHRNNLNSSILFRISDGPINRNIPTSASFILSWKDPSNFDMAGVAFRDDNIYTYFAAMRNSTLTYYPEFPYSAPLLTGLQWNSGSVLNMTISKKDGTEDLYINGTKFLSRTIVDESPGFIGISTSGANDIAIKRFAVSSEEKSPVPYNEYYDYVANGGNLTVYNTNGYGTIFDNLSRTIQSSFDRHIFQQINGDEIGRSFADSTHDIRDLQSIHQNISAHNEKTNRSSISDAIVTYYPNSVPISAKIEKGNINYLDIFSLIRNDSVSEKVKNMLLDNITNSILEEESEESELDFRQIPMIFQSMEGEGDIFINTSFVGFPNAMNARLVDLTKNDTYSQSHLETNLTSINLDGYDIATIHSKNIVISGSGGIYSEIVLGNDQTITLDFDRSTVVEGTATNGSQVKYENVTSITLESGRPIDIRIKTPSVKIDGRVQYGNLLSARLTGIDGQDTIFNGQISFKILSSDTYTLTDSISFNGIFDKSLQKYDEFSGLIASTFAFDMSSVPPIATTVFSIPLILAGVFLFYKRLL